MSRLATAPRRNRFVILRTASSPPVALHPASRRRSYLRLWSCDQLQNGLTPFQQNVLADALVPANAGTHNHRRLLFAKGGYLTAPLRSQGVWVPAFAGTTPWKSRRARPS